MKRVILELSGNEVGESRHMCTASLIWPRPGISERTAVASVFSGGGKMDWTPYSWEAGIIFKETVQGAFALRLGVTERVSNGQISKFISFLESSTLKTVGSEISGIVSSPVGAGLIEAPFAYLSKGKAKGDVPLLLGAGSIDMCADKALKAGAKKTVRVKLAAPRKLYALSSRRRHGSVSSSRKVVKKPGDSIGEIVLDVRAYD